MVISTYAGLDSVDSYHFSYLYFETMLVYCGFSVAIFHGFVLLSVSAARARFSFSADLRSAYSPNIQVCSFKRSHRTAVSIVQQGSWIGVKVQNLYIVGVSHHCAGIFRAVVLRKHSAVDLS